MSKRKRQDVAMAVSGSMTNEERTLYNIIHAKKDMGIWSGDIKKETTLPETVFKKSLKMLQAKGLIKEVVNIQNKARKLLMAVEFQPSKDITGGDWYSEGKLDTDLIDSLQKVCVRFISRQNVATADGVLRYSNDCGVFPNAITTQQINEILRTLVLDNEIVECKSTGFGDFASVPVGRVCYKCKAKSESKAGAMASIPCGVCPRINFCTPDGIVSPTNCVYYQKWLDF